MKKSIVSFTPTTTRDPRTQGGQSYAKFFRRLESSELPSVAAKFNADPDRPRNLAAIYTAETATVEVKAENGHVVAKYTEYK